MIYCISEVLTPLLVSVVMQVGLCLSASKTSVTTVLVISFRTDRSGQTVQTQIRLLLEEQSDQGLHCLQFHLHFFYEIS